RLLPDCGSSASGIAVGSMVLAVSSANWFEGVGRAVLADLAGCAECVDLTTTLLTPEGSGLGGCTFAVSAANSGFPGRSRPSTAAHPFQCILRVMFRSPRPVEKIE